MANIVVFGGSGFIGRQAVYAARANGHHAVVVDMKEPDLSIDEFFFVRKSPENLEDAIRACDEAKVCFAKAGLDPRIDAAINYIALFRYGLDEQTLFGPNVATAHNIAAACRRDDIFLIHTGAVAAHGNKNTCPIEEHDPFFAFEPYAKTKARSEEAVFWHVQKGLRAITLRPGGVYGPEGTSTMMHQMFETAKKSPILPCTPALNSYVSTIDIGRAAIFAIENQHLFSGSRRAIDSPRTIADIAFNIADTEPMRDGDVLRYLARRIGRRRHVAIPLPRKAMYAAALSPKLPFAVARLGQADHYQSNKKFKAVFESNGFVRSFNSTQEGLDHTLRWLYAHHWREEMPSKLAQAKSVGELKRKYRFITGDLIKVTYDMQAGRCSPHAGPSSVQVAIGFVDDHNPSRLKDLSDHGRVLHIDSRITMENGRRLPTLETPIHARTILDIKVLEGSKYR